MFENQKLKIASVLYKFAFPIYRQMYFNFKNRKDKFHLKLIRALIKPGNTVLDIGANIGFYGRFLSDCVGPGGLVYCFEPDATNFMHLKKELKTNLNVTLIQKAVAKESGNLTLYTSGLLNVDHRTYEPENYLDKYYVEKVSIDEYVNGRFNVGLIKMDIQGFEADALKGMKQTIAANPDLILFTEFWPYGLKCAGSSAVEVYDLLTEYGFKIHKVADEQLTLLTKEDVSKMKVEFLSDANILASRRDMTGDKF